MPVRGAGWYKRPYRLSYEHCGREISKAFHWPAPRDEEIAWLERNGITYRRWDIRDGAGAISLYARRWP